MIDYSEAWDKLESKLEDIAKKYHKSEPIAVGQVLGYMEDIRKECTYEVEYDDYV